MPQRGRKGELEGKNSTVDNSSTGDRPSRYKSPMPQRGVRKGEQTGGGGGGSGSGERPSAQKSLLKQRGVRRGEQEGGTVLQIATVL